MSEGPAHAKHTGQNVVYLTGGLLLAGVAIWMGATTEISFVRVLAYALLVPASLGIGVGGCRLAHPFYLAIGFPEVPRIFLKEARVQPFFQRLSRWFTQSYHWMVRDRTFGALNDRPLS